MLAVGRAPVLGRLACASLVVVFACGSRGGSGVAPASTVDAADALQPDPSPDASPDGGPAPFVSGPEGGTSCTVGLTGMTADPVALCLQGDLLSAEITKAYVAGRGVAQTWDDAGHTSGHAWQDDLGLASALASFVCSARYYGNGLYPLLGATMADLASVLRQELPAAPAGYDGEIYFRLRNAEAGMNYLDDAASAAFFAGLADQYGRAIQSGYAQDLARTGDAGASGIVLGTADAGGGVDYAPAEVILGAAALLDMASLHAGDSDPSVPAWRATALSALDYVWRRGRDPVTGLFFRSLVTSGDADHDALLPSAPAPDVLSTDVQAQAVLGLARVQAGVDALAVRLEGGAPDTLSDATPVEYPYLAEADTLVQGLTGASGVSLWDGAPPVAGTLVAAPGAFLEAVVPSTGDTLVSSKTTLGNALLLGGIHRLAVTRGTAAAYVLGPLRAALLQDMPANSSLFTVVTDANGFSTQDGYLRASSRDWRYATVYAADGGAAAEEPAAREYRADALHAVAEGLDQLWYGTQDAPPCAP